MAETDGKTSRPQTRMVSPASLAEHRRVRRRLLWSLPAALVVLALLVLLGPSAEEIERKFTPYGAEGPLRLMPEIAIEDGEDALHRQAQRQQARPEAAPHYEVLPPDPQAQVQQPPPLQTPPVEPSNTVGAESEVPAAADIAAVGSGDAEIDLLMPSQLADADFIIRKLVRPLYPMQASTYDRLRPLIVVEAAFFLNETADIIAVIVQKNDGGEVFAEVVREAMLQWEFEPRWRDGKPPAPRWLVVTWRFRSPFAASSD